MNAGTVTLMLLDSHLKVSGTPSLVPPGFVVYPSVSARWVLDASVVGALAEGESVDADVVIAYAPHAGRYELRRLCLAARGEAGPEITGALLRTVRVQQILQSTALESLALVDHLAWTNEELGSGLAAVAPPDEHLLTHVAIIYRAAELASANPGQAVAERFGMQRRTAANWIARSRAAGYFDRLIEESEVMRIAEAWFLAKRAGGDGDG